MRLSAAAALLAACPIAFAQLTTDPDWKETEAPPPPPLRIEKLIPLEIQGSSLRYGVDPASIAVGADNIVRYVVVATSRSGAVNAMYEGIRCNTAEVKVYARHYPGTGWTPTPRAEWRPLHDASQRHSLRIAREGACMGDGVNRAAEQIVRDLSATGEFRFRTESTR